MNHRLNGRVKTVVSFEGHIRVNVCDPALGHGSLDITWRHKWYRKNELSFIKIKDLCASRKWGQTPVWEIMCLNHASSKVLVFRIHKVYIL